MKRKYFQEIRFEEWDDHEWEFEFPRVGDEELDELDEGIEYMARAPIVAEDIFVDFRTFRPLSILIQSGVR